LRGATAGAAWLAAPAVAAATGTANGSWLMQSAHRQVLPSDECLGILNDDVVIVKLTAVIWSD